MSVNTTSARCIRVHAETRLRLLAERHAEAFLALMTHNRAQVDAWIAVAAYAGPVAVLRASLRQRLLHCVDGVGDHLGMWHQGALAGLRDSRLNRREPTAELGSWLDPAQQGKGLLTQACLACQIMVRHAFEEHGVQKVEMSCAADNLRRRAIPERLGLTLEGTVRRAGWLHGGSVDGVWYGLLVSEWQDRGRR
jgi:ribosomal-protein-serine acetyltransferase